MVIPSACFGSYRMRLLIGSCWPIVLLFSATIALVARELYRNRLKRSTYQVKTAFVLSLSHTHRQAVQTGLQRSLPLILVATFVLVPSTATRIFMTFLCDEIEIDAQPREMRRYLHDDLALSCDGSEYTATRSVALAFLIIWPLGTPVLYIMLLMASREALQAGTRTALSRATDFLSADYRAGVFWWEPVEMCRKLTLTGWVTLT
eukprot:6065680-Prymnesium_polylepis.2